MRASVLLAFIVGAGCFADLDEGRLTGAARDLGSRGGASDLGGGICDAFAGVALGVQPPNWTAVSGNWKMVGVGGGRLALGQTARIDQRVLGWMGTPGVDLALSATIRPGDGGATDCEIVRYHDEQNYYSLCLQGGSTWTLGRLKGGTATTIDAGKRAYDPTQPHALTLSVLADQLVGTLDGATLTMQRDTTFTHGGIALATDSQTSFAQVCAAPL